MKFIGRDMTKNNVEVETVVGAQDKVDAAKDSPTFTGVPKAPTAATGTNTTQVATTAYVQNAVAVAGDNTFAHGGKAYKYSLSLNSTGDGLVFGYEEI
ncbi:hypothetical protein [Sporosarcina psychrophila]|uniref:Uncharacterized protein n=1 Tax=Sporosarcina psychrophila TaxID=1476 RepID=A0ABV2KBC6_SPOPS